MAAFPPLSNLMSDNSTKAKTYRRDIIYRYFEVDDSTVRPIDRKYFYENR